MMIIKFLSVLNIFLQAIRFEVLVELNNLKNMGFTIEINSTHFISAFH